MGETMMQLLRLLAEHGIELVAAVMLIMGRSLILRAAEWLKLRADSEVRAYLMAGLDRAVEYGQAEARRRLLAGSVALRQDIQGVFVREDVQTLEADLARDFALGRFPDALARFGVDAPALEAMIRARLPAPPAVPAH